MKIYSLYSSTTKSRMVKAIFVNRESAEKFLEELKRRVDTQYYSKQFSDIVNQAYVDEVVM